MRFRIIFIVVTVAATIFSNFANCQKVTIPAKKHHLVVIAHRGDHTEAPENTLAAYSNAIKNGADYVEIDLRTTRDGELVIMHDGSVDRMTNGKGAVKDMSFSELRKLQVQAKDHPEWPSQTIPSFSEVLQLCHKKINIYLDFKDASVSESMRQIKKYGMQKNVIVYINSDAQYKEWRSAAPEMPLMISLPDSIKTPEALVELIGKVPVALLDGSYQDYTPEMVSSAKKKNIQVWPDIQSPHEGPEEWKTALAKGFGGLQTDHPKLLVEYLKKEGIR